MTEGSRSEEDLLRELAQRLLSLVLAAQPGERFLFIRIEAGDSRDGGWSSSTVAVGSG